jgi:hypothetical protein
MRPMTEPTSFRFDSVLMNSIDDLKESSGATTRVDVIRRAIALYNVAQAAKCSGGKLVIHTKHNTQREIVLP